MGALFVWTCSIPPCGMLEKEREREREGGGRERKREGMEGLRTEAENSVIDNACSNHCVYFYLPQTVEEVAQHVDRGYRMDAPDGCPDSVYSIMSECWKKDPSQRPNFARIERLLQQIKS